jgi:1-acyl-sn-glycerol-3-phosphate acyltransferase
VAVFGAPVVLEPDPGLPGRDRRRQVTEQLRVALHDHVLASVARTGIPLPDDELPPAPDAGR